ncbi:MAG: POTRA domain-containing protein, partial [Methylococcales bacterium]
MSKLTYLALTLSFFPMMSLAQKNESAPPKFTFMVNKFVVEGDSTLSEEELADYFKPLEQKSYDLQSLQQVGKTLETKIRRSGFSFYRVILPSQLL